MMPGPKDPAYTARAMTPGPQDPAYTCLADDVGRVLWTRLGFSVREEMRADEIVE